MIRLPALFVSAVCIFLTTPALLYSETTAYIPNFGDDNVKRVLTSDETNFTAVDACDGPYGAAVTPDGSDLVVTCSNDNSVTVIPTENFVNEGAQANISLGDDHEPRGVAIESRGLFAYVANFNDDTVDEINISSGDVTDTFNVGRGPWGIAAFYDSPNATFKVYVTNHDDDTVSVIDAEGVDTINNVGDGPIGAALTPEGDFLYVANHNADTVAVIDTQEMSRTTTISVGNGPWGVAMASDGDYVFVTNSLDDTVSVIDTSNRTVSGTFAVGNQPMGVAAPAKGDFAYVVNHLDGSISKITTSGSVTAIGSGEFNGAYALGAFISGTPPGGPTELTATADGSSRIILNWTDNSNDELGFEIERRKDEEEYEMVATVDENETTYTDYGLARGTTYHYRVRAFNETDESDYSNSASATTDNEKYSWCFIQTLLDSK